MSPHSSSQNLGWARCSASSHCRLWQTTMTRPPQPLFWSSTTKMVPPTLHKPSTTFTHPIYSLEPSPMPALSHLHLRPRSLCHWCQTHPHHLLLARVRHRPRRCGNRGNKPYQNQEGAGRGVGLTWTNHQRKRGDNEIAPGAMVAPSTTRDERRDASWEETGRG